MKFTPALFVAALAACSLAQAAPITTSNTSFDGFANGSVDGQGGWASNSAYAQEVVDLGGGNKVWRVSNNVTASSFDDMPFAPRPGGVPTNTATNPTNGQPSFFAGESSTGAGYDRFIGSFDFRSVATTQDPGARITISPDNGSGGRQGFIALASTVTGVTVETYDVDAGGSFIGPNLLGTFNHGGWHNLRYEIDFVDGDHNDVARIYLDNVLATTVHSWESFYDQNQAALHPLGVPVQTLLFRLSGTAAPTAQGFYIDNVTVQLDSSAVPEPASIALVGFALAGLGALRRRRA